MTLRVGIMLPSRETAMTGREITPALYATVNLNDDKRALTRNSTITYARTTASPST